MTALRSRTRRRGEHVSRCFLPSAPALFALVLCVLDCLVASARGARTGAAVDLDIGGSRALLEAGGTPGEQSPAAAQHLQQHAECLRPSSTAEDGDCPICCEPGDLICVARCAESQAATFLQCSTTVSASSAAPPTHWLASLLCCRCRSWDPFKGSDPEYGKPWRAWGWSEFRRGATLLIQQRT